MISDFNMGNVQQRGKADKLTKFQREKLKYDFYTFFGKFLTLAFQRVQKLFWKPFDSIQNLRE